MTLVGYQQALCDLIASPELCLRVRNDAESALQAYDLNERERRRLAAVVWQKGMSTSCTLYRLNRITPIVTDLPLSTLVLGDALIEEAELYWRQGKPADLQFGPETERFAGFLRRRLDDGELVNPYLQETLAFELALNRVRVAAQRWTGRQEASVTGTADADLVAVVDFRHDPLPLLDALSEKRLPAVEPPCGEFFLLIDARGGDLSVQQVDAETAKGLRPAAGQAQTGSAAAHPLSAG